MDQPGAEAPDTTDEPGWQDTGSSEDFVETWEEEEEEVGEQEEAAEDGPLLQQQQQQERPVQQQHHQQPAQDVDDQQEHEGRAWDQAFTTALQEMHPQDLPRLLRHLQRRMLAPPGGQDAPGGAAQAAEQAGAADGNGSDASSSGSMSNDEAEADEVQAAVGCTRFDPNIASRHQYLGDVDELEGSYGHLQEGTTARLPLLVLDGVVLFPGFELPLLLNTPQELHLLDRALVAPPPLTRLLAVLPGPRMLLHSLPRLVCCTAEVRQMRRQGDDERSVAVLALGRQRAEVVPEGRNCAQSQVSVTVRILPEGCTSDVPKPMRQWYSPIHPALTHPWDLQLLEGRVRQLMELVLLPAASFQGTPLELSYWVSHNLPLQPSTRQLLLMCSCPADRLRLLLELLKRLDRLCCSACGTQLATTAEVLAMTTEGIGGTYVNSHGYVHELVTFSKVHGLRLYGAAETAHSWFPGYAWTIAHCGTCGQHMGWRFTATRPGLMPRSFWGIRRPGLLCATAPSDSSDGSEQGDAAGEAAAGGQQQQQQQQQRRRQDREQHWMDLLLHGVRRGRLILHLRERQQQDDADG